MLLAVELFWLLTIKSTSFVTARCSEKKKKNKTKHTTRLSVKSLAYRFGHISCNSLLMN